MNKASGTKAVPAYEATVVELNKLPCTSGRAGTSA